MTLQQLKYIVEIADCRSVTNASKKLFVSQPYLSKVIADVESKLKKQIFIRSSNGLQLTTYGHKVYLMAQSIIKQMELLDNLENGEVCEEKNDNLSFSVANLIIKDHLLLDYFSTSNASGNRISFCETTIDGCMKNIEEGLSDFAIVVVDDYQKELLLSVAERKGLEYLQLDEGYRYYHLHRQHPLANQQKIDIDSLTQYPFVSLEPDEFASFSEKKFQQEYPGIHANRNIVVNHYHSYLSIVKNNGAFMLGNKWQIDELEKMGIKSIRFSSLDQKVYLAILKKTITALMPESKKFIQLFKESYGLDQI